ncbi:hypothetical protein J31TS4_41310 [Paenibacillus sp. J31TS4]|uniref:glycosyltransferase family 4 protein n=1 Tax=Paenibacillus sp. J31TS4 TaxID=2807195 RepID=UPI001B1ADE18|nr:glycosyltransferase family 4 protein [Paenibacillus sp. J31TS4]GIP40851.1 hypothetical protein J31TS4_41310 [Paenibacillus sp. J31TS4]
MHILIVAPEQIPVTRGRGGSVEICVHHIAEKLADQHKVTVVSRSAPRLPAREERGNLTILRVATGTPRQYLANVLRLIKDRTFDWIQVDNRPRFVPAIKELFPRTPVSLFLHSLTFVSKPYLSRQAGTACLARADLIVANSQSLQETLAQRFPASAAKMKRVYLGADLTRFRPPSPEERRQLRLRHGLNDAFVVVFAGRIIPRKGLDVLIRALRLVRKKAPRVKLVVAGSAQSHAFKKRIQRLAIRSGVPTTFLGHLPHAKMRRAYWLGDCFVCPSQRHEAFGLVNVEAMATGLPCIASRIGGIGEIIRNGHNGLLVNRYWKPESLAKRIRRLLEEPELAERLGKQAREDVLRQFDWKTTAANLAYLYRPALIKMDGGEP